jgi:hypothetical protein
MPSKPSEPVIGSYVHHKGKCWNVSTIYRQCSSPHHDGMYYETLVWEYDLEKRERGGIVHQAEGFDEHFNICKRIYHEGEFWKTPDIEG